MKHLISLTTPALVLALLVTSCVPSRMHEDLKAKKMLCEEENTRLKAEALENTTKRTEMEQTLTDLQRDINYLRTDTSVLGNGNRRLTQLYNELSNSYEQLVSNRDRLLSSNQDETRKLIRQLQQTQEDLLRKEDSLKARELTLTETGDRLRQREAKINELQRILNSKDSAVNALRDHVTKALMGFDKEGLTIEKKNGKVYVSLEERLLFASGSTTVDPKGESALKELAKVLEKNTDINVMIEGHTDNVPIKGGPIRDNWDLSVLRATSVVRILEKNGNINMVRITAGGKSEFQPLDIANTPEARRKNRRIEVILTPKLDDLFQLMESK